VGGRQAECRDGGAIDREARTNSQQQRPPTHKTWKNRKPIIDLTLSTRRVWALATWEVDENLATASDHEVIVFSWPPLVTPKDKKEPTTAPSWNIDQLRADKQAMEAAGEHWRELSDLRVPISLEATKAELEDETRWMQDSLGAVLDKHAPGRPSSARSKRWWTEEIKKERRLLARVRRDHNHDQTSFEEYRRARNQYYSCIRRAKRLAWARFLEGVFPADEEHEPASDPERCWKALRYTKPSTPSYTPAIKVEGMNGQPGIIAATAEEKEGIFMAQAFPPQPPDDGDIHTPNTEIRIRACEIREALGPICS
jgi:hypothetical protein